MQQAPRPAASAACHSCWPALAEPCWPLCSARRRALPLSVAARTAPIKIGRAGTLRCLQLVFMTPGTAYLTLALHSHLVLAASAVNTRPSKAYAALFWQPRPTSAAPWCSVRTAALLRGARTFVCMRGSRACADICAQVPLWFCVACPVVLGLLAPFLFNLGSGAVAQAVCDHFQLPQDECNDVWCAALACPLPISWDCRFRNPAWSASRELAGLSIQSACKCLRLFNPPPPIA